MTVYNLVMLAIAIVAIVLVVYYFLRPDPLQDLSVDEAIDPFCLEQLILKVKDQLGEFDKINLMELNMNRAQIEKVKHSKRRLAQARKTCCYGDLGSKAYVKRYIKKILTEVIGVTQENVCHAVPFDQPDKLTTIDKFAILLYIYRQKFGTDAMVKLISVNHFDEPYGSGCTAEYKITAKQINMCFEQHAAMIHELTYDDYLDMVVQRVYERFIGLGVVDELLEMNVDSVRCGTSGTLESLLKVVEPDYDEELHGELPNTSYNAVWIMYKGRHMHLSFLGFGSQKEFVRVASRVYRYNDPGTLSANKGGIVGEMMNGSRVVATRPPAAEAWAFFVRKLDIASKVALEKLHPDKGNDKMIQLFRFIIGGEQNVALTGEQGTGKTTTMMSLIQFIKRSFTIRTQEMSFELNLRKVYPERDILSFRETESFSGQDELNLKKKTDGSCDLLGEVATAEQAAWLIQTGETGSNQVMFTGHMKTARLLVEYFRDCCLEMTPGSNEKTKEMLCARVLTFNAHLSKNTEGHRFIERITMIEPHFLEEYPDDLESAQKEYYYRQTDRPVFDTVDLLRWEDGEYFFTGEFSPEMAERIAFRLSAEERAEFKELLERMHVEVAEYKRTHDAIYENSSEVEEVSA